MQVKASVWTQRERPAAAWLQGKTVAALGVLLGWACAECTARPRKYCRQAGCQGQAGPTCPPEGSILLTLSSGGAGLPWSLVREPRWPTSPAGEEGYWSGGAAPVARSQPSLSQLSVQSVQELVGESIHMEPGPGHIGHSRCPPPGDCPLFAYVSVHLAACHLPRHVLSPAGSQARCSLSHLLERWSWGFLIADSISSFPRHGWSVLSAAFPTSVCQHHGCHKPSLWRSFSFIIGRKRAALFLGGSVTCAYERCRH